MRRRSTLLLALLALTLALLAAYALIRPFPPDTTPPGAYLRIAMSISKNQERDMFAYLETEAQWAAYSIRDMKKETAGLVASHYPKPEAAQLLANLREEAEAPDGSDVFVVLSTRHGFADRLRRDLSGIASVEVEGDRASVVTVRGTRYPFRRRENGIWGLTIFTAELMRDRERAARDLAVIRAASADYARAAGAPQSRSTGSPASSQPASTTLPK